MQDAAVLHTANQASVPLAVLPDIDSNLGKCLTLFASHTAFTVSSCRTPDMPIVYASPQFCSLTGYTAKEVLGRNCRFLQGPGTSRQSVLEIRDSIQEDRGCTVCILNYTKQKKPFWNQLCLSPISDQHGVAYYLGIQTNVTGAVLAYRSKIFSPFQTTLAGPHGGVHSFEGCSDIVANEVKIAEELGSKIKRWHSDKVLGSSLKNQDFRPISSALLPSSLLGPLYKLQHSFCLVDPNVPDMPIVHASEGFLRLTGRPRNEVVGHNCRFMQGAGTDQRELDRLRIAVSEERPVTVSLMNYKHDGTPFWNHLHIAPIRNADGKVVFFAGVQLDITKLDTPEEPEQCSDAEEAPLTVRQPSVIEGQPHPPRGKSLDRHSRDEKADRLQPALSSQVQDTAQAHLTSGPENLIASLRLLSPETAESVQAAADVKGSSMTEEQNSTQLLNGLPQARENIGPLEKQMQRSIVGTVRVVCRSLSAKSGLRRSFQDQHRPHADELLALKDIQSVGASTSRLDMPTLGSSHI